MLFTNFYSRIMERTCRTLRFVIRCIGVQSNIIAEELVLLLVSLYGLHSHSCFLYLVRFFKNLKTLDKCFLVRIFHFYSKTTPSINAKTLISQNNQIPICPCRNCTDCISLKMDDNSFTKIQFLFLGVYNSSVVLKLVLLTEKIYCLMIF